MAMIMFASHEAQRFFFNRAYDQSYTRMNGPGS